MDIAHWFGNDLTVAASGDLLPLDEPTRSEQRLVRRLLTNPGDYIWHPAYGAGLPSYIGKPRAVASIKGIVRAQLKLENAVASSPAAQIAVTQSASGVLQVAIVYWNNNTGSSRTLSFNVNR